MDEGSYVDEGEYDDQGGYDDQEDQYDDNLMEPSDEEEEEDFDSDDLPAFANAENRGLSKVVKEQEQRSEALQRLITENDDRVKIMEEHLKNVKQELTHTQRLVSAKAAE